MFELAETADELSGEGEEGQEAVSAMLCDIERSVERISVQIQGDQIGYLSLQVADFFA
jgi:hypothetical protein